MKKSPGHLGLERQVAQLAAAVAKFGTAVKLPCEALGAVGSEDLVGDVQTKIFGNERAAGAGCGWLQQYAVKLCNEKCDSQADRKGQSPLLKYMAVVVSNCSEMLNHAAQCPGDVSFEEAKSAYEKVAVLLKEAYAQVAVLISTLDSNTLALKYDGREYQVQKQKQDAAGLTRPGSLTNGYCTLARKLLEVLFSNTLDCSPINVSLAANLNQALEASRKADAEHTVLSSADEVAQLKALTKRQQQMLAVALAEIARLKGMVEFLAAKPGVEMPAELSAKVVTRAEKQVAKQSEHARRNAAAVTVADDDDEGSDNDVEQQNSKHAETASAVSKAGLSSNATMLVMRARAANEANSSRKGATFARTGSAGGDNAVDADSAQELGTANNANTTKPGARRR